MSQTATYLEMGQEEWAVKLALDGDEAVQQLVSGAPHSLDVLAQLLVHPDERVATRAAQAFETLGPRAVRVADAIVSGISDSTVFWVRVHCARALATMNGAPPAVLNRVADIIVSVESQRIRSECCRSLLRVDGHAAQLVMAAWVRSGHARPSRAEDAFVWLGESSVECLIDALQADGVGGTMAARALARIGWLAVDQLEAVGRHDIAIEALQRGVLEQVLFADDYRVLRRGAAPGAVGILEACWQRAEGHGEGFVSYWATTIREGLRLERISFGPGGAGVGKQVVVASCVVPAARCRVLGLQMAVLRGMDIEPHVVGGAPPVADEVDAKVSTRLVHTTVSVKMSDNETLQQRFTGYETGDNVRERFRAEGALRVIEQAQSGLEWLTRRPSARDAERLEEMSGALGGDAGWLRERVVQARMMLIRGL